MNEILGFLILLGCIAIAVWVVIGVLRYMGIEVPGVVKIVAAGVIGIVCLLFLAQMLGIGIPALR